VMSVGTTPPNPLELLLSTRFKATLAALSDEYEMIIIDSPPVELVSEALVLAPMATSVAFVVGAMSTPAPLVRKSLERIQRAGGQILGLVVNKLDFKHAQRYYGEFGSSSYNYGGYGTSPYITNAKGEKPNAAGKGAAAA
jgi:succinoglycan biosynthesis transport protein ExoP